jgi:hypothetical protein
MSMAELIGQWGDGFAYQFEHTLAGAGLTMDFFDNGAGMDL